MCPGRGRNYSWFSPLLFVPQLSISLDVLQAQKRHFGGGLGLLLRSSSRLQQESQL